MAGGIPMTEWCRKKDQKLLRVKAPISYSTVPGLLEWKTSKTSRGKNILKVPTRLQMLEGALTT
jgi:hypothetical protein